MADAGSGDKSEKPSPGKLRKARQKGDIPRSKEVNLAVCLVMALIMMTLFFPYYRDLIQASFLAVRQMAERIHDDGALHQFMLTQVLIMLKFIATLIPIPFAAALSTLVPGGWIFVITRIKPDFKKLNPISGAKRMFSMQHYVDVLKMIAKCLLMLALLWSTIKGNLSEMMGLQGLFLRDSINHGLALYESMMRLFIFTIVLFAVIDVPLTKFFFTKKMKMSKKEVRDEHKNNEGNPQVKGRIRNLQRQMAMGQINKQVPLADVVITNPTHFAVALKYDPKKAPAPYIVAKGVDDVALYIRSVAGKHKIDVVEFPPLARAVYHSTRVNQQIPAALFRPIAQVLTYVMQLQTWRNGQGEKPRLDTQLPNLDEVMKVHESV
ncbi:flagellar type III secretion system protein FlhB [Pantoea sp. BIGb0393]|uniref:Flagellar biosynthetic protein FlhB n=1 Tax=Pantoea nemavictus TaxID=2726955 RepID=A0ABU8PQQ9_9GAMM|nr:MULTISPECIES: flagellar biosynthesis protein FlhB [Pantoea]EJL87134.1 flagellar biosynthetic protein FlhB [Pantoea sp. GM01]MBA0035870.1 flagellar type III secretion system protein FlhB [Pantoea nemavictus]